MLENEPITFLVVAAGQGRRLGGGIPKQYRLLNGRPLLWYTLKVLQDHPLVAKIVPIIAPGGEALWHQQMGTALPSMDKLASPVTGGTERQYSVANGLASLTLPDAGWVAVHDGARPLLSPALLDRLAVARREGNALVTAVPATDTVKRVGPDGLVCETLDRKTLWLAQTPQLFRAGLLRKAHRAAADAGFLGTDDVSLLEWMGEPVRVVHGEGHNLKVTQASDLTLAERWLATPKKEESPQEGGDDMRIGQGFDVHRWQPGRPLRLGGVDIPHTEGLLGHSDADVLLHAVVDALLGAAGLGDIGRHFPDNDPQYKGINSCRLVERVMAKLEPCGWKVINLDGTVICQTPRLAPYIPAMEQAIAALLHTSVQNVNVKATTTERLGYTGRGEGAAAQAVVLLTRRRV